jgi:hypothetical protein
MKLFFGDIQKIAILVPGDSVDKVAIKETDSGGNDIEPS